MVESDLGFVTMSTVLVLIEDCGLGLRVVSPVGLASSRSNLNFLISNIQKQGDQVSYNSFKWVEIRDIDFWFH